MPDIAFFTDAEGFVDARADDRLRSLALWLVDDVQSGLVGGLNLLADLDDVAAGRKAGEEWEGNAWRATIAPAGVTVQNLHRAALRGTYPLDQVRRVALDYWRLLVEGKDKTSAVAEWEAWNGRPHPRHHEL